MTPLVALDLSLDGISVLTRAPDGPDHGKWYREGIVRLDAPDMAETLGRLRDKCAERVGGDFTSILIIPDSQILFTSLERDDRKPEETIRSLLRGRTPYDVEDLTFDYVQRGDRLQVAVIALETLLEAETFAADFGFRPVTLIGNPRDSTYPGRPDFGKTGIARELLGGDRLALDLGDTIEVIAAPAPEPLPDPISAPLAPTPAHAMPGDPAGRNRIVDTRPAQTPPSPPPRAADTPVVAAPTEPDPDVMEDAPDQSEDAAAFSAMVSDPVPETPDAPQDDVAEDDLAPVVASEDGVAPIPEVDEPAEEEATAEAESEPLQPQLFDTLENAEPEPEEEAAEPAEEADLPVFTHSAKAPVVPMVDAPRFTSKRKASRILPNEPPLTSPTPPLTERVEPPVSTPDPVVAAAEEEWGPVDTPPVPRSVLAAPPPPVGTTPPPRPKTMPPIPLSTLAAELGAPKRPATLAEPDAASPATEPRRKRVSGLLSRRKAPTPAVPQDDAAALAMPGIAREKVTGGQRGSARLGLYMTLSLLALLAAVGLGSAFLSPDDTPNAVAEVTEAETPVVPVEEDVALLLPAPGSQAGTSAASPIPDLVTPPQPIPSESPEELAEADEAVPVEALPEALADAASFAVARDLAQPPAASDGQEIDFSQVDEVITSASAAALPTSPLPTSPLPGDAFAVQENPPPAGADVPVASAPIGPAPETPDVAEATPDEVVPEAPVETAEAAEPAVEDTPELVAATAEGTLAPGGYTVILGQPVVVPTPRPGGEVTADVAASQAPTDLTPEEIVQREALLRVRPVQRPEGAPATEEEDPLINGLTREELTRVRPSIRPASITEAASQASAAEAQAEQEAAANRARETEIAEQNAAIQAAAASLANQTTVSTAGATTGSSGPTSRLALAESERPRTRPRSVERAAARIVTQRREQASAASASTASAATSRGGASAPAASRSNQTIRSSGGSVARAATQTNQIRLRDTNLIGVYGRQNARRAIVRLGNGRYVKVEVGDRLDRGRVTAIGESELVYQRGGRSVTLRMPRA